MNPFFLEALDTREHPVKKAKKKTQAEYIMALTWLIQKTIRKADCHPAGAEKYVTQRLPSGSACLSFDPAIPGKQGLLLTGRKKDHYYGKYERR